MNPNPKLHRIQVLQTKDDVIIESPVISEVCNETNTSAEKKPKDYEKPLYLKRV